MRRYLTTSSKTAAVTAIATATMSRGLNLEPIIIKNNKSLELLFFRHRVLIKVSQVMLNEIGNGRGWAEVFIKVLIDTDRYSELA